LKCSPDKTSGILKTSLVGSYSTIFRVSAFSANGKPELVPSVPVYIGEANCEKVVKVAEKTGKTINELIENNFNVIFKTNTNLTHIKNGWCVRSCKVDHFKNMDK